MLSSASLLRAFCSAPHFRSLTVNMHQIQTFVFFDMETTGLPRDENNTTKMTELSLVSILAKHLELGVFPRVYNKLSLCLNPCKLINPVASDITGLSNELLADQQTFRSDTVELIKQWLDQCLKPVCFVAHNGDYFDFPILRAEILKTGNSLPDHLLALDSIPAFKALDSEAKQAQQPLIASPKREVPFEFDDGFDEILVQAAEEYERTHFQKAPTAQRLNETTPKKQMIKAAALPQPPRRSLATNSGGNLQESYKLQDLYSRLTNRRIEGAHEAEGDVLMLITCAAHYAEKFVTFANGHARVFNDVPPMKPGRRLGF